ncbi:hypothetical protein [Devosia sp. LC5]|uniref:hypothetical protein n=1 Tax=Devosia sp. LC5 TaxID=1502724 RepID=UPI00329A6752
MWLQIATSEVEQAAGSQDGYFRALSTETGEELSRVDLPTGATATPMSNIGAESGDQFVALTAGGTVLASELATAFGIFQINAEWQKRGW